jgi:hypothetical protein
LLDLTWDYDLDKPETLPDGSRSRDSADDLRSVQEMTRTNQA